MTTADTKKPGELFDTWLTEQLAPAIPCDMDECPLEVEWRMNMPCCNTDWFFCEPHAVHNQEIAERNKNVTCHVCDTLIPASKVWFGRV